MKNISKLVITFVSSIIVILIKDKFTVNVIDFLNTLGVYKSFLLETKPYVISFLIAALSLLMENFINQIPAEITAEFRDEQGQKVSTFKIVNSNLNDIAPKKVVLVMKIRTTKLNYRFAQREKILIQLGSNIADFELERGFINGKNSYASKSLKSGIEISLSKLINTPSTEEEIKIPLLLQCIDNGKTMIKISSGKQISIYNLKYDEVKVESEVGL